MIGYKESNAWMHSLDPITKFIWLMLVSFWLLSIRQLIPVISISLGIVCVSIIGGRINLRYYARVLMLLLFGSIWLIFYQGLFRPGEGIAFYNLHFSYDGLILGSVLSIRTVGLLAASLAFSQTTNPKHLAIALVQFGVPYRLAHVAYLGLRFLPLLEVDIRNIHDAQLLRGVKLSWQKIRQLIVALTATELRRVDEIAIALETRAFGLYKTRTELEKVTMTKGGVLLVAITAFAIIVYIYLVWFQR